ncbi:FecCD family ABC transporter permease [Billgrantia endophytica]|uniref:Fe(3+)-siderophore ABC transporter permease n=1 Tax=Billgrantia endophytica TaxID=2033802 RepID=A0A2N7TZL9_9GAMM|nr:iron chelate uptake ABC transporter family permease subunit [Halomonas endophytica]PMR73603.1 Fe(3+)-siderophore ABC transporter permease [Halomonas endophytica]
MNAPDSSPVPVPLDIRRDVWRLGGLSWVVPRRVALVNVALGLVVFGLAAVAMTLGQLDISLADVRDALFALGQGGVRERIIFDIRLPRTLTALFVGAALGVSGAVFQSISRNALGSPDIIGFTTGAATGALAQILMFGQGALEVALAAVVGGVLTAVLVYALARRGGVVGSYRLVLTGIGVGAVLSALNGLMLVKGDLDNAVTANLWLAGSLHARTWVHAIPVVAGVLLLMPLVVLGSRALSMIEMGDDMASQLGIRVERVRLFMVFLAVLLAALATGAAGPIAFIALAAPQLVRRLSHASGVPVVGAALMGSCLLLATDVLIQSLPLQISIPIGRMTGIVGGIYLIWLLTRSRSI